ncbi:hypothetical protein BH23CHL1_BH23CHL1_13500 [soil metagenome]
MQCAHAAQDTFAKGKYELAQRKRPRYIDGDVQDAIETLAIDTDWGPTQIQRHLEAKPEFAGRLPKIRTFQDVVKEVRSADPTETWSVHDSNPETANLVLETIAVMMVQTGGSVRNVTKGLAEWIVKVGTICPKMSYPNVYRMAWLYNVRIINKESTTDLDAYLAFKPWKDAGHQVAYTRAIGEGWITAPPAVMSFTLDDSGNKVVEPQGLRELGTWLKELNELVDADVHEPKGTDHG